MNQPSSASSNVSSVLILAAVILGLYFARDVLIPFALALTLNFLLTPAVMWLQRIRLGRIPAVFLVLLLFVGAAGGVGWVVANQLVDVANELPQYRKNIKAKIDAVHSPTAGPFGRAAESLKGLALELSSLPAAAPSHAAPTQVQVVEAPTNGLQELREYLVPLLKPLGMAGIVLIFTVFMLINREDLRNRLLRLVGLGQLNVMTQALDDAAHRISRYLMLQVLVNAIFGVIFGLGLLLIGVPNAALWGVIAGSFRIVPYVGSLVGAALPFLLALAVFNTWGPPLFVFVLFSVLELITGNFVEPWLYGSHTGISSLALLVTTVFWTVLWGWAGLVLSTPLTVCVIVLGRYVPQLAFLHILLGDEPVLAPEAQFYQRLLAMDQNEARLIAEIFLKGRPLVELYDLVLIPALGLAEQDRHKGALDEARETFLFLSANELIAELAEYKPELEAGQAAGDPAKPAAPQGPRTVRVFCIASNDQADEVVSSMLAQLLEQEAYPTLSFPLGAHIEDLLTMMAPEAGDVVCVSALPPFAFAHARDLCKRIRTASPSIKMIVGLWGYAGDAEKAKARFGSSQPERLVTTLADAMSQVREWQNALAVVEVTAE